jgi:dephospho-CoA kinase
MKKKIKIGVTGGIGSGKSTFCKFLQEEGVEVIYADQLSKELLDNDMNVKKKVEKAFGKEAYKEGKADKKYLAEKVFSDPEKLERLNNILHPVVIKKIFERMEKSEGIIAVEAALIYEADMEEMFDYVILVTANDEVKIERGVKGGRFTKEEFYRRSENQIKDEEKMKRADFIFINEGEEKDLKDKVKLLMIVLTGLGI